MRTKNLNKAIVFLLTVVTLSGCTFAKHKPGKGTAETTTDVCVDNIDYKVVNQAVIQPKCLACHGTGAGLVNLDTYSAVQANIGKIQSAVQAGRMPPGKPLSQNEKDILSAWVTNNTPEAVTTNAMTCNDSTGGEPILVPVLAPNFESISAMILQPRCIGCHGEGDSLDFSSYAKILENKGLFQSKPGEESLFVVAVASGMMPPKKNPDLSEEEVSVIRQWVMLGIPERADLPGIILNPPADPEPTCMTAGFEEISTKVFSVRCIGCHGDAGNVNLENYANVKNHLGIVESAIASGFMPPKQPLADDVKKLVLDWIRDGAPETPMPKTSCDELEVK